MSWTEFKIDGKIYCCRHLQTAVHKTDVDGTQCLLRISYSNHCFTDEKENGPLLFRKEGRYWSKERYDESIHLPNILIRSLEDSYCIPHYSGSGEQYHYIELSHYIVFFRITKPNNSENELRIKVSSAYPIDEWGRTTIPKGKAKLIKWVLSRRLKNMQVLK